MRIDMRPMLSGEVLRTVLDDTFPLSGEDAPDIDTVIDGIVYTSPAIVKGEIVNMGGYIRLDVTATVRYDAVCARCLKPLQREFSVSVSRTVVNSGSLANTADDEADDYLFISDGFLEPDTAIAEELMMAFPMRELCDEDCKGLCPKCGKNLNEGDCGCVKKEIDPRLAILQKLLEKS